MPYRRLRPGEHIPDGEPSRYQRKGRTVVTLRWQIGSKQFVETDEHRIVDGVVQVSQWDRAPMPEVPVSDIEFPSIPDVSVPDDAPKTRPRIPLDDACDREHANWQRRNEFHNYRIRRAIEAGPTEPVTLKLGESYKDHAICRGLNPTIFLPETRNAESTALAKRICAVCPVRDVCPVSETTRGRKAKAA